MTFKQAVEEIKKGNKVKHKNWNSLVVDGFYNNTVNVADNRGYLYYFVLDDFLKIFRKFKIGWVLVSIEEYKEFCNNWR